ncbi:hypothetical protein [Diaminobutyricimonas sp. TR449]|uniref:hypothetical protein n=1 Tax=Diaminobutyricimonas sp. TR449 TaxID=2708076 RepID=UPI00141E4AF9|nr:hypothetical protein [Diaminobutyricimonas sp. TR449]
MAISASSMRPVPGDPDLVARKAADYENIADAIRRASENLKRIADLDGITSEAIEAVRGKARDVADSISLAEQRYRGTASALGEYAIVHKDVQEAVKTAIADAQSAEQSAASARNMHDHYTAEAATPGPEQNANQRLADYYADRLATQTGNASSASSAYTEAMERWDTAAMTARNRIKEVVSASGLNNDWWDDWGDIIKTIGEIAGVLALFLSWVPILGQVLLAIAMVVAVVSLVAAVMKAMKGDGSWSDVLFAALGAVLTIFGGSIFKYLGKVFAYTSRAKYLRFGGKTFKSITGMSKTQFHKLHPNPLGMQNAMKEVFLTNPFSMKASHFTVTGFKGQAFEDYLKFYTNPMGFKTFDILADSQRIADVPMAARVTLGVLEVRSGLGKIQTITNDPFNPNDPTLTLTPDAIAKNLANGQAPRLVPWQ